MEIAAMPIVADAAPQSAAPRTRPGDGGSGPGKPGGSFADLMAGAMTESSSPATPPTALAAGEPAAKDAPAPATQTPTGQVPWNMMALLAAQLPTANLQKTDVTGDTAAVTAIGPTAAASPPESVKSATFPLDASGLPTGQPLAGGIANSDGGRQSPDRSAVSAAADKSPASAFTSGDGNFPTPAPQAATAQTAQQSSAAQASPASPLTQPVYARTAAPPPSTAAAAPTPLQPAAISPDNAPTAAAQTSAGRQLPAAPQASLSPQSMSPPGSAAAENTPTAESEQATAVLSTAKTPAAPVQAAPDGGDAEADTADASSRDKPQQAAIDNRQTTTPPFTLVTDHRLTAPQTPAAAAATTQTPANPADPYNVAGQIVDQARLISRPSASEMVIKLKPEHLGDVTLKIAVDGAGAVSATFHAANSEVRGAIEATITQLRQDLTNQGLKVDYVGVYASLDHFFQGGQQQAPQSRQQQVKAAPRRKEDDAFTAEVAAITGQAPLAGSSGIDYRI